MNKLTKIIGITMLVLVFVGALANHYSAEVSILYMKNISATQKKAPQAYLVPENKFLTPIAVKGYWENCMGLTFKTEWGNPVTKKTVKNTTDITFRGAETIRVIKNSGLACFMLAYIKAGEQQYIDVAGDEKTAYGVVEPILEVTPENIDFFGPREKANKQVGRLIFKIINVPRCEKMYHLMSANVDVLEFYGNTGKIQGAVVDVADNKGHFYQVLINDPDIDQTQIERIVASMKIVDN